MLIDKSGKSDISTCEGTQVNSLTTSYGLSQIISDPSHILPNSSSCIDLIFTNQPRLVTTSGFHPSLHPIPFLFESLRFKNLKIFFIDTQRVTFG